MGLTNFLLIFQVKGSSLVIHWWIVFAVSGDITDAKDGVYSLDFWKV